MVFELSNKQRKYLGLDIILKEWEKVPLKGDSYRDDSILMFDGNILKRHIISSETGYSETQYNEETENRSLLLPKTSKGKPKKLTGSTLESRTPIGVYFRSDKYGIMIGNHTTQTEYYCSHFEDIKLENIEELKVWLDAYMEETSSKDLSEIKEFSSKKRKRVNLKEGDYFVYKVDRKNYGFGRLICDIRKLRKDPAFKANKNYGLMSLMTQPLVVKIYHLVQSAKEVDFDQLKRLKSLPAQYIMDNSLFYGNYEVIGNQPLEEWEYDFPISYSKSIRYGDINIVYLQYGLIYLQTSSKHFNKYLAIDNPDSNAKAWEKVLQSNPYRKESIGASLDFHKNELIQCISLGSNQPYWAANYYGRDYDLRNPKNKDIKKEIFKHFGLDAEKSYAENLKLANKR